MGGQFLALLVYYVQYIKPTEEDIKPTEVANSIGILPCILGALRGGVSGLTEEEKGRIFNVKPIRYMFGALGLVHALRGNAGVPTDDGSSPGPHAQERGDGAAAAAVAEDQARDASSDRRAAHARRVTGDGDDGAIGAHDKIA